MSQELFILVTTAATLALIHTLIGPDHYLPFIVMSKARKWSLSRTLTITFLCGLGHVLSSVVLGGVGIAMGFGIQELVETESWRGNLATWAMLGFGLAYMIWGLRMAYRKRPHEHAHSHHDGITHIHTHQHGNAHAHLHGKDTKITPWILFVIFVLGPCEPLIPLLMFPAAKESIEGVIMVSAVFSVITIATMMGFVIAGYYGLRFVNLGKMERYTHALAGGAIFFSGFLMMAFGL